MHMRILAGRRAAKCLRFPIIIFVLLLLAGWVVNTNAQTVTNLYIFAGQPNDGSNPHDGLVRGSDGDFYGTTSYGGTNMDGNYGCGTVFRISPSGTYTSLYSFTGSPDGAHPGGGVVQGSDGNFYGTTYSGGTSTDSNPVCSPCQGVGTVFRVTPSGGCTILYSFGSQPNDGASPSAGLIQGSDGWFYGTTPYGGTQGHGTVFRISASGSYTNLYSFTGGSDGAFPSAELVLGVDGNFYGTTEYGGAYSYGTVYRLTPGGGVTNLHSFGGGGPFVGDGANPIGRLVQGSDGNFYGTTISGGSRRGCIDGCGTVFRVSPSGSYTNLYSFMGNTFVSNIVVNDGSEPGGGLVQGSDGYFYGTTGEGGTSEEGTAFRISTSGSYTSLYSFVGVCCSGPNPCPGLVQGSDGSFYGTTIYGGNMSGYDGFHAGSVFKLTVPLSAAPWPINQITGVAPSGSDMVFNVDSIAYETYQLQFTTDLTSGVWSNVPGVSVTNSVGAWLTVTNFGGAVGPQGFYRFDITP
ncbi:MAG TPA: choice-of-anchor tandem repeat GloVer-containing protein [Verrucomicrobiae bacterium]|nr:choice-of-anchor tandem repeat GloVer-containing protein [Verrucomicrobiae bacterium]